jgi:hypothetical protein
MSSSSNTSSTNIIPKDCVYGCNTRIYWNNEENAYFEVFSKTRHHCPNRKPGNKSNIVTQTTTSTTKPTYYSKKSYYATQKQQQSKPKMSNSLELLSGSITDIQKKYEILSDIVTEYNGMVHGSQSRVLPNNTSIDCIL